jgi:hypothetical protein
VILLLRAFAYCILAATTTRSARRTLCGSAMLFALLLSFAAPNAGAGVFEVANCEADRLNYSTRAFEHYATRRMMIKRACNPVGPGLRGLIAANVVRNGRVKRGSVALITFTAPPGTYIHDFRWAGTARRRDCRFAIQMWADRPSGKRPLANVPANRSCPRAGRAQIAVAEKHYPDLIASRIVQRVICVGKARQRWCSARGANYIRTRFATVGLVDDLSPTVEIVPDTPLARGEWVRGTQALNYTASDNSGVRLARSILAGSRQGLQNRSCVLAAPTGPFAAPMPCPNGAGQIDVPTYQLTEGSQTLAVEAEDAAGNVAVSAAATARIDNTPPARIEVAVDEGDNWRNRNHWALVWQNPAEPDRAPIVAVTYDICESATKSCRRETYTGPDVTRLPLTVPGPGEWTVSLWRRDAAGNEAEDNASVPVTLRYDPEPPKLAFDPSSAADPTLVTVPVTDEVSGLADGAIEIGAADSGVWRTLSTTKEGSRLTARIDDAALPAGTYLLRARARDQAGNEASTDRRSDGQPMVVTLPLRSPTTLGAGFELTIRKGKRRRVVLRPAARIGFGDRIDLAGRLVRGDGRPVAGAAIQVLSATGSAPEQLVETLATDADGRFRSSAIGTNTRRLRLAYAGSPVTLPTERTLEMRVPAATSVRVSRKRLRNGQTVTFSGAVKGLPVPAAGKLVEVQVRFTDRWQTFRTTRSDPSGRWSSRYRFERTRGLQRYHFRIRLPAEGGYPFETSVSRTLVVTVRGR